MKHALIVALVLIVSYMTWVAMSAGLSADTLNSTSSQRATVRVKVLDDNAATVHDATVSIRDNQSGDSRILTAADPTGNYLFQVAPNKNYDVVATTPGRVASQLVSPKTGEALQLTLVPNER